MLSAEEDSKVYFESLGDFSIKLIGPENKYYISAKK